MNPFDVLRDLQSAYLTYVHAFQKLKILPYTPG